MQWYYSIDGRREGPIEEQELFNMAREGNLKPADLVWNQTLGNQWMEASSVPGMFDAGASLSPPPPVPPQPLSSAGGGGTRISCTAPLRAAWNRMVVILFSPFDLAKWFGLGFGAWLSTLGEGGGGFNFRGGDWGRDNGAGGPEWGEIASFFRQYLLIIAIVIGIILILSVGLSLVFMWLKARGTFIFLDNVAKNRAEIEAPWREYKRHGNSLFLWSFAFGLVCLVVFLLIAACGALIALPSIRARAFQWSAVAGISVAGALFMVFAVATGYIQRFLADFVVPIMYKFNVSASEAWGHFLQLFKAHARTFVVYGLFYFLLTMLSVFAIFALIVGTLCVACCLLIIPYVGTVLILPLMVFFRTYSLEFFRQFSEEYSVFPAQTPPTPN